MMTIWITSTSSTCHKRFNCLASAVYFKMISTYVFWIRVFWGLGIAISISCTLFRTLSTTVISGLLCIFSLSDIIVQSSYMVHSLLSMAASGVYSQYLVSTSVTWSTHSLFISRWRIFITASCLSLWASGTSLGHLFKSPLAPHLR